MAAPGLASTCSYLSFLLTLLLTEVLIHRVEYALDALIGRSREENELTGDTLFIAVTNGSTLRTSSVAVFCTPFHTITKSPEGCKASRQKMHLQGSDVVGPELMTAGLRCYLR